MRARQNTPAFETSPIVRSARFSYSRRLTWEPLSMELTDWIVILAVTLMAIAFFCARTPANWSRENRARRLAGTRMLVQAACSLWAALLIVARGLFALDGLPGLHPAPLEALTGVAILLACGCYWSIRGSKLLKPRRLFTVYW